jgi:3D (Asp-Asp-Asp) domain-containing protein
MRAVARSLLCLVGVAACTSEIVDFHGDVDGRAGTADAVDAALSVDARTVDGNQPNADGGGVVGSLLGRFRLTYYYVTDEADYLDGSPDDTALYDVQCNELSRVPEAFESSLAIEGTGRLSDGRVLNYSGGCACATSPCYHFVDAEHPWGSGSGNRALVPFRSLAVDRDVLVIGRKYWVAELDGVLMPGGGDEGIGGFEHDGCVSADDTGGGIGGMHVDFFAGLIAYYLELDGYLELNEVTLYEGGARCR